MKERVLSALGFVLVIAIVLSGCKGTDNNVQIEVFGPGVSSAEGLLCDAECSLPQPLSWLQSQLLLHKSVKLVAQPAPGAEFIGWVTDEGAVDCGTEPACEISVQAQCNDVLDLRHKLIPCKDLSSEHKNVIAAFVEQDSIVFSTWYQFVSACAVTAQDGIRCWGDAGLAENVPAVINPTELKLNRATACVRDDTGLKCWGSSYYLGGTQPVLADPVDFTVSTYFICAIDQGQVICWGRDTNSILPVPEFNNPTRIASVGDTDNVCVIDDEGLQCWGSRANPPQRAPLGNQALISLDRYQCEVSPQRFDCTLR